MLNIPKNAENPLFSSALWFSYYVFFRLFEGAAAGATILPKSNSSDWNPR